MSSDSYAFTFFLLILLFRPRELIMILTANDESGYHCLILDFKENDLKYLSMW